MPTALTPILEAERRTWSYWSVDGLPSLLFGVSCLVEAAFLVLMDKSTWLELIGVVLLFLWLAILFLFRRIVEWMKARITYPRTGYVATPAGATVSGVLPLRKLVGAEKSELTRHWRSRTLRQWFFLTLVILLIVALYRIQAPWICLGATAALAFLFWLIERELSQTRSYLAVFGIPFIGVYMLVFHVSRLDRLIAFVAGLGILMTLDGSFRLIRYLRHNPAEGR